VTIICGGRVASYGTMYMLLCGLIKTLGFV